jgi:hypothetical protein
VSATAKPAKNSPPERGVFEFTNSLVGFGRAELPPALLATLLPALLATLLPALLTTLLLQAVPGLLNRLAALLRLPALLLLAALRMAALLLLVTAFHFLFPSAGSWESSPCFSIETTFEQGATFPRL